MPSNSSPKKFDAVTVIGLAVAIAIIIIGLIQSSRNQAKMAAWQQAETARIAKDNAERLRQVELAKAKIVQPGPEKANPAAPGDDVAKAPKPVVELPDITVTSKKLALTFSSRGGALKHATLVGVHEDASKKDGKGLEILTEILPGKRTFGLSKLLVDDTVLESPENAVWTPKDSGAFDAAGNRTVAYELTLGEFNLVKTFTVLQDADYLLCDLKIENRSNKDVAILYNIEGPQGILLDGPPADPKSGAGSRVVIQAQLASRDAATQGQSQAEPEVLVVGTDAAKNADESGRKLAREENLWGVVKNRFFMVDFISLDPKQLIKFLASPIQNNGVPADKRFEEPNIALTAFRNKLILNKGTVKTDSYALYLGPSDDGHLEAVEAALKPLMPAPSDYHLKMSIQFFDSFNWRWPRVDWLARQMMWVFKGLHHLFGNFGIAVALMTILIKLCLHPLQRKMMVSMSKMQKLQPELNKVKEKYKNATTNEAKMKMQMEQQDVMKKAGVNPVGGCLPMFIQIPVFSALYGIFNHAFDMRGAEFLWIKDLSLPDNICAMPKFLQLGSWIPTSINLLPILYIILSVVQTRMQPQQQKTDDPQQEMNRKMMMMMPIFISFMFYTMPAGLVLYFAVSACWGMVESWYIKKFLIKADDNKNNTPSGTSGTLKTTPQLAR